MKTLPLILGSALLASCTVLPRQVEPEREPEPLKIAPQAPHQARGGGVFNVEAPWNLTADSRAFRSGDLLTIVLQETTQASKSADTKYGKSNKVAMTPSVLLGKTYARSELGVDASRDFNGTSTSTQQNTLQGAITVVVDEVLPNGLLRVRGEKNLQLNQGEEFIKLAGYVRAADIDSENRVSSQRIANARIAYSGRGSLADVNEPGWLARFFNSSWMPF